MISREKLKLIIKIMVLIKAETFQDIFFTLLVAGLSTHVKRWGVMT